MCSSENTAWEQTLDEDDANLYHLLRAHLSESEQTPNWLNDDPSMPVRALDMSEQNYEEQAAQQQAPSNSNQDGGGEEELEDTFHIDLE